LENLFLTLLRTQITAGAFPTKHVLSLPETFYFNGVLLFCRT